jgi:hypothetical protein
MYACKDQAYASFYNKALVLIELGFLENLEIDIKLKSSESSPREDIRSGPSQSYSLDILNSTRKLIKNGLKDS